MGTIVILVLAPLLVVNGIFWYRSVFYGTPPTTMAGTRRCSLCSPCALCVCALGLALCCDKCSASSQSLLPWCPVLPRLFVLPIIPSPLHLSVVAPHLN